MDMQRNLVGILFCLVCGLSFGEVRWPWLNMDLLYEDIKKEVDLALQVVNQPNFQGWRLKFIKQAAPRMHIGLVELWLQFQKFQTDQDKMWRKMTKTSEASCQDLKDKIRDIAVQVPERMDAMEKRLEIMSASVKTMEDAHETECANRRHLTKDHQEDKMISSEKRAMRPRKGKFSSTQLVHKVAALTVVLNGHNELLVELYQRMTALEGVNEARYSSLTPQDGSGDGH
ncbi:uncharacterized protein ACNLHF_024740 [Anomaloglossus baeobatrachus]|uniref:uncharacterized protein LOC142246426 n=1 Tax=Anomaloglossus baeobatrachus TaxID=238106 RepID=UPI003F4F721E